MKDYKYLIEKDFLRSLNLTKIYVKLKATFKHSILFLKFD